MFLKLSLFACMVCGLPMNGSDGFCPNQTTHREVQVDNEQVRVWKTTIYPASPLKMHRHDLPRIVVALQGGTLKKITDKGEVSDLVFETGKSYWLEADPEGELHGDVNESDQPIVVVVIEPKNG